MIDTSPLAGRYGLWTTTPYQECSDDDTVSVYKSRYVACQVAYLAQSYGSRTWSGLWSMAYFFLALPFCEYVRGLDAELTWENWSEKSSTIVLIGCGCATFGLLTAPILLVIMLLVGPGLQFAFDLITIGGSLWIAAFLCIT